MTVFSWSSAIAVVLVVVSFDGACKDELFQHYMDVADAAVLMDGMVESIRTNGRTIRPICSYAASYLRERPETHDLVAL